MTILQAHKFYWYRDGASNYAWDLAELLRGAGHTVIPFAMRHSKNMETPFSKFFVSEMQIDDAGSLPFSQKLRTAGRILYSREAKRNIGALLDEYPVDVAHIHNIYHQISPSILPEIKKRGIPIVATLHDFHLLSPNYNLFHHGAVHEEDARGWYLSCVGNKCVKNSRAQSAFAAAEMIWHHKIMRYYERYVDRFIAPSRFIIDLHVKYGWDRNKFVHVPHPTNDRIKNLELRIKNDGQTVLYAGRLSEEKGLNVLLEAAKKTPKIPYVIAGTGPLEDALKKNAPENVTFVGYRSGEALQKLFAGARLLVAPSICYDVYPLSVLEGKAMGKVVIGSKIGGIPELLPPELLVPANNAEALAEKITAWHGKSPDDRNTIGMKLQKETETVNDAAKHIQTIEEVYRTVCTKKS